MRIPGVSSFFLELEKGRRSDNSDDNCHHESAVQFNLLQGNYDTERFITNALTSLQEFKRDRHIRVTKMSLGQR